MARVVDARPCGVAGLLRCLDEGGEGRQHVDVRDQLLHLARRGEQLFQAKAECASCHVPPLFTEPGWNLHTAEELGIDDFQANRSPARGYRTAPLRGLWTHETGGFYHDGRFPTLRAVVDHYDTTAVLVFDGAAATAFWRPRIAEILDGLERGGATIEHAWLRGERGKRSAGEARGTSR